MISSKSFFLALVTMLTLSSKHLNAQVVVIVNRDNSVESLSMTELKRIYLGHNTRWPSDGSKGRAVTLTDYKFNSETVSNFYNRVVGLSQSKIRLVWMGKLLSGEFQSLPVQHISDAELIKFISENQGAIGFVDAAIFDPELHSIKKIRVYWEGF